VQPAQWRCPEFSQQAFTLAPFDFVFIDPPFANTQLLTNAVTLLVERNLVQQAMYLEFEQQQEAAVEALMQQHGLSS
jgi:16S rRNA G966 N2-methylase RsmD